MFVYRQEEGIFLFHIIFRPALGQPMQPILREGGGGLFPQSEAVLAAASSGEVNQTVELHLSGSWVSRSPNIRYGLVLGVNIFLMQLCFISLWHKFFLQLSNTCKELCLNVLFVRK